MNRPILIVSIYAPSDLNATWYALQKRFIPATTTVPYEFRIFLSGVNPAGFVDDDILAATPNNEGHAAALRRVFEYFAGHAHPAYLVLDSDCFPVASEWHEVLLGQMHRFGKKFAAPVRTENLDLFPHPSAMFVLPEAIGSDYLDFSVDATASNLLGEQVQDIGAAMQEQRQHLLPMLRTNVLNVHPVAAAIYHHLFYHHGAGSRHFAFRVLNRFGYYDHWFDVAKEQQHRKALLTRLLEDPERFIGSLMGSNMRLGHL